MARDRRKRRGRPGVMQLNRGSSSFGRSSTLPLNQPGGTFGAGRPAGGGIGAGSIERALASEPLGLSVMGSPEIGPPPVSPIFGSPEMPFDPPPSWPVQEAIAPTIPSILGSTSSVFPRQNPAEIEQARRPRGRLSFF